MITMRAIVVEKPGPPEALRSYEVPRPEPGPGEARLRVAFVGMNPVDAMVRRDYLDWMPVRFPFTPGLEHTGVVDAIGPGVDHVWLGQRVLSRISFGGYADYSVSPVQGLHVLPKGLSLLEGCVFRGCSYTAWHALHKCARLAPGERVLVHSAAGAVGFMALQIAREAGATAVGVCGGPRKVEWLQSFDLDPVIDYSLETWRDTARGAVSGHEFDVILDGNGGPRAEHNLELLAPLGRLIYIGATSGHYPVPIPISALIAKSVSVAGMTLRRIEEPPGGDAERTIIEAVCQRRWKLPIGEVVPLGQVVDLHRRFEARELHGRAVVEVGGEL